MQRTIDDLSQLKEHISKTHAKLRSKFGVEGELSEISSPLGDSHAGGRSVRKIRFGDKALVYKPRTLAGEQAVAAAQEWLAKRGLELRSLVSLNCGSFGFAEWIDPAPLTDEAEAEAFYERAGALLFLSWAIGLTDLHYENVIAAGTDPMLVDCEAILWRPLAVATTEAAINERTSYECLLSNGLLPVRTEKGEQSTSIGGFATSEQIGTPFPIFRVKREGNSASLVKEHAGPNVELVNLPHLESGPLPIEVHAEAFERGFALSRDIFSHATMEELESLQASIAHVCSTQRVILRETSYYGQILSALSHPSMAASPRDSEALCGCLTDAYRSDPKYDALAAAEAAELLDRDIPFFTAEVAKGDLKGRQSLPGVWFDANGVTLIGERVARAPLLRSSHARVINVSIASQAPILERLHDRNPADAIVSELNERAIHVLGQRQWLMVDTLRDGAVSMRPGDFTLYSGWAGIGLLLSQHARCAGADISNSVSDLLDRAHALLDKDAARLRIGALDGAAGLLYFDHYVSRLAGRRPLPVSSTLASILSEQIEKDDQLDWISGAAGVLRVMTLRADEEDAENACRIAKVAATRLLEAAHRDGNVWNWKSQSIEFPLAGFAHGAAGISLALEQFRTTFPDAHLAPNIDSAIEGAQRFILSALDHESGLRNALNEPAGQSWCHGALGIYLASNRLACERPNELSEQLLNRARRRLNSVARLTTHDLCHGAIGAVDAFIAREDFNGGITCMRNIWRALADGAYRTPHLAGDGLFTGIAGVGYQALRSTNPETVPSILTLNLPMPGQELEAASQYE
ncbi:MAG: hypothetical protein BroJett013_12180 [Alphaproteobacteria bacterium]|nr:MAG: hypothetical protein BroJett013_12180 [Alphaproteobacteria bacterium]